VDRAGKRLCPGSRGMPFFGRSRAVIRLSRKKGGCRGAWWGGMSRVNFNIRGGRRKEEVLRAVPKGKNLRASNLSNSAPDDQRRGRGKRGEKGRQNKKRKRKRLFDWGKTKTPTKEATLRKKKTEGRAVAAGKRGRQKRSGKEKRRIERHAANDA